MSKLFNGGPYKQRDGSSITETSTNVNGGSVKMAGTSTVVRAVAPTVGDYANSRLVAGCNYGQAEWGSFVTTTGVSGVATGITNGSTSSVNYSGLAKLTKLSHGLLVGDVINIANNATGVNSIGLYEGPQRVVVVVDTNNVILNTPFISNQTGITYAAPVGVVGNMTANNYAMRTVSGSVHGQNNTKMMSPASDYGRNKVHAVTAVRTRKVGTAIRAGNWVDASGQWINKPGTSNDFVGFGTDEVTQNDANNFALKGEYTYRYGGPSSTTGDYDAKTD